MSFRYGARHSPTSSVGTKRQDGFATGDGCASVGSPRRTAGPAAASGTQQLLEKGRAPAEEAPAPLTRFVRRRPEQVYGSSRDPPLNEPDRGCRAVTAAQSRGSGVRRAGSISRRRGGRIGYRGPMAYGPQGRASFESALALNRFACRRTQLYGPSATNKRVKSVAGRSRSRPPDRGIVLAIGQ